MISILKNYVRGSIIDNAPEYYKNKWEDELIKIKTEGLLDEVLEDFYIHLSEVDRHDRYCTVYQVITTSLEDAAVDWDILY